MPLMTRDTKGISRDKTVTSRDKQGQSGDEQGQKRDRRDKTGKLLKKPNFWEQSLQII